MAEITKRRCGELVRGVFSLLLQYPDGLPPKEVLQKLEQIVPPTEFESSTYPKNPSTRRYERIVRFTTIGPVKAGWMVKSKGLWLLTDEGREAYDRMPDPEEFFRESDKLYRKWKETRERTEDVEVDDGSLPGPIAALEEAEETAWTEIQDYLMSMNPYDLQDLVAALLRAMDYDVSWVAPPGRDYGVDIIAYTDPLGASGPRMKVQVKRRADKINADGLRSFLSTLSQHDVGVFVATGGFTPDAESEARRQEQRKVTLLDAERLVELWVEHYDSIAEESRQLLPLKAVWYLAPRA